MAPISRAEPGTDRNRTKLKALGTDGFQHRDAVHFRHHNVQNHPVVFPAPQIVQCVPAIVHRIHPVVAALQNGDQRPGKGFFVLGQQ